MLERKKIVYVIQELPGTKAGTPKINIMSAREYGDFNFLLPEFSLSLIHISEPTRPY